MNILCSSRRPDRIGLCPFAGRDLGLRVDGDNVRIENSAPHVYKAADDMAVKPVISPLGLFSSGVDQYVLLFIT
jgi:hypothetical protein